MKKPVKPEQPVKQFVPDFRLNEINPDCEEPYDDDECEGIPSCSACEDKCSYYQEYLDNRYLAIEEITLDKLNVAFQDFHLQDIKIEIYYSDYNTEMRFLRLETDDEFSIRVLEYEKALIKYEEDLIKYEEWKESNRDKDEAKKRAKDRKDLEKKMAELSKIKKQAEKLEREINGKR